MGLAVALASCGSARLDKAGGQHPDEPLHLTLANNMFAPPPAVLDFIRTAGKVSDSSITIDERNRWRRDEPDQERATIADVAAGKIDMAWVGARVLDVMGTHAFDPLLAPFLVDSYALQERVFAAGIPARMLAEVHLAGITALAVLPGGLRKVTGIDHPFVAPDDYSGAHVGTSGGDLAAATFRALGANSVRVAAESSLDGVDAIDFPASAVKDNLYYKTARYLTANVDLSPRPIVLLMNAARFTALPLEKQQFLRRAADDVLERAGGEAQDEETQAGVALCHTPMTVVEASDAQRAALARAVAPVYAQLERDAAQRGYLEEIRALKASVAAAPDTIVCQPREDPSPAATPIDGVWTFTVTKEELAKFMDPADLVPENYGTYIEVYDHGHYAETQESDQACTWTYGTYAVDGDGLTVTITDGGGLAPDGALAKPGERRVYRWSLYRDQLTLTMTSPFQVTGSVLKVDKTPSIALFPARCAVPDKVLPGR
jgi:TRAP-type C4-dicarboxylate transport system substrate-binding protein